MKKLLLLFGVSFIAIIIAVTLLSKINNAYTEIENGTFHKITKSYDIKAADHMIKVTNLVGKEKEGILLLTSWPWLPLVQLDTYNKSFFSGASYENNY